MKAGVIRAALLLTAVALGAILIANAFPGGATPSEQATSPGGTGHTPNPAPSKHKLVCPSPRGIRIAVENASGTPGLAAAAVNRLKPAGYTINVSTDVGNASTTASNTTIYNRSPADKVAALCMKNRFFTIASVARMPTGGASASPSIAAPVRIAVFLGSDYATKHPVG
jgi:LytR cell envelope-related transcriptional attenuator